MKQGCGWVVGWYDVDEFVEACDESETESPALKAEEKGKQQNAEACLKRYLRAARNKKAARSRPPAGSPSRKSPRPLSFTDFQQQMQLAADEATPQSPGGNSWKTGSDSWKTSQWVSCISCKKYRRVQFDAPADTRTWYCSGNSRLACSAPQEALAKMIPSSF